MSNLITLPLLVGAYADMQKKQDALTALQNQLEETLKAAGKGDLLAALKDAEKALKAEEKKVDSAKSVFAAEVMTKAQETANPKEAIIHENVKIVNETKIIIQPERILEAIAWAQAAVPGKLTVNPKWESGALDALRDKRDILPTAIQLQDGYTTRVDALEKWLPALVSDQLEEEAKEVKDDETTPF